MSDTGLPPEDVQRRARLTAWLAGVLTLVIGFATLFRPLVSDVGATFTVFGLINTALLAIAWQLFRRGLFPTLAPVALVVLTTLMALPLILLSGGAGSQFAPLIPLFPVFGLMLGGRRLAIAACGFWMIAVIATALLGGVLTDLTGEARFPAKDASRTLWLLLATGVGLAVALHFERATERMQDRLRQMAERDPLTDVLNRRGLEPVLRRALAHARRHDDAVTLLLLDVDWFKRYNDARGHAQGDAALRRIAAALVEHCRAGDDVVARYGGEEFVVVSTGTDRAGARVVAEKLRKAVSDLGMRFEDRSADLLTATVGYVTIEGEGPGADEVLRLADAALYEGKRLGRDQVFDAAELDAPRRRAPIE